jgi:hypothetical protein
MFVADGYFYSLESLNPQTLTKILAKTLMKQCAFRKVRDPAAIERSLSGVSIKALFITIKFMI